jgi:hypothetical protein
MPLMDKKVVDGKLKIDAMPLNHIIVEKIIPLIELSLQMSRLEILAAQVEEETRENTCIVAQLADRLESDLPSFYGPVSYANQQNRTALITRKMEEVEKAWRKIPDRVLRNPRRGMFQVN